VRLALAVLMLASGCASVMPPAPVGSTSTASAQLAQLRAMNEAALAAEAANEANSPEAREMASFLHVQLVERRRLRESAAAADKNLRDERKATEAQKLRADALQERVAQLQQKLDALGEIEKSLSDRQTKGR